MLQWRHRYTKNPRSPKKGVAGAKWQEAKFSRDPYSRNTQKVIIKCQTSCPPWYLSRIQKTEKQCLSGIYMQKGALQVKQREGIKPWKCEMTLSTWHERDLWREEAGSRRDCRSRHHWAFHVSCMRLDAFKGNGQSWRISSVSWDWALDRPLWWIVVAGSWG